MIIFRLTVPIFTTKIHSYQKESCELPRRFHCNKKIEMGFIFYAVIFFLPAVFLSFWNHSIDIIELFLLSYCNLNMSLCAELYVDSIGMKFVEWKSWYQWENWIWWKLTQEIYWNLHFWWSKWTQMIMKMISACLY